MNNNQTALIELLSLSLRGKKASTGMLNSADWDNVLELAHAHSVLPLIYTSLNRYCLNETILTGLKAIVFRIALQQAQNLKILQKVIDEFQKANISLIAMKGLVLRDLYPVPDTRTMCDFDLSVKEQNYEDAIRLLSNMGFREIKYDRNIHAQMVYGDNLMIELHKNPFDSDSFKLPKEYLDSVWNNAVPITICDKKILTFSDNDTILYLFLHLAKHYELTGFGLRQLCDIVLFIEAKQKSIDWKQFCFKIEEFHISRFVYIVISICNQLFDMTIPEIFSIELLSDVRKDTIIQDIISGGTYGKSTPTRSASNKINRRIGMQGDKERNKLTGLLRFFFPLPTKLYFSYPYLKRHPYFLPVAWVHRWIYNIVDKERRELIKVFFKKDAIIDYLEITENRRELVHWLLIEERQNKGGKLYVC